MSTKAEVNYSSLIKQAVLDSFKKLNPRDQIKNLVDPGHPDAGPDGYVSYPDINPLTEMVDLMGATRAYGLNSSAVQAEKGMITSALEIAKG